jgi:hypothetical protein
VATVARDQLRRHAPDTWLLMRDGPRLRKEIETLRAEGRQRREKADRLLEKVLELQPRIDAELRHEQPSPARKKPLKK